MIYEYAKWTDAGQHTVNQDSCICIVSEDKKILFAAVADGMGGIQGGKRASSVIADEITEWFNDTPRDMFDRENLIDELTDAWEVLIEHINMQLLEDDIAGGSTLTMLMLFHNIYVAANIGDSRIYQYDGAERNLYQLTKDHSWIQEQLDAGVNPAIIEANTYLKNRITRCLGVSREFSRADYYAGKIKEGDKFLICSDGLRHTVRVSEFIEMLQAETDIRDTARNMVIKAKENGEKDNITAVVISIQKDG